MDDILGIIMNMLRDKLAEEGGDLELESVSYAGDDSRRSLAFNGSERRRRLDALYLPIEISKSLYSSKRSVYGILLTIHSPGFSTFSEVSGPLDELDFALPLIEDFIAQNKPALIEKLAREVDPAFAEAAVTTEEFDPTEVSVSSNVCTYLLFIIICQIQLGPPVFVFLVTSGTYIHNQSSCHCHIQ